MKTDYKEHYPRQGYSATISVTGTKDELVRLSLMLEQIQAEDSVDFQLIETVKEELDNAIHWLMDMN